MAAKTATSTTTTVTAYGFAREVNAVLKEAGFKELPAQMFYTYKNKGLIGTEEKPLTAEFAAIWVQSYMTKKTQKEAAKAAKVAEELKGETPSE